MNGLRRKILVVVMVMIIIISGFFVFSTLYKNKVKEPSNSSLVLADENFSINFKDGNYFDVDTIAPSASIVRHLTITNVTNVTSYVSIALMDINKKNDKIKIKLVDNKQVVLYDDYLSNIDTEILKAKEIGPKETLSYDIILTNLQEEATKQFSANIMVYKELGKTNLKSFRELLLATNEIRKESESSYLNNYEEEGLYITEDDEGVSYVFRGNVVNNYVLIENVLFRILRINGDGSVRLISDGNIIESSYKSKIDNSDYASNVLFSKSNALEKLNNWYMLHFSNLDDYIINSNFCSEKTYYLENIDGKYFNAYKRIVYDDKPSLKCDGSVESMKIGLPSVDELRFAGASLNNANTNLYLYNTSDKLGFYTLTGSKVMLNYNVVDVFSLTTDGKIEKETKITSTQGYRAVISLDKNVVVEGLGSLENPYKLVF